MIKMNFKRISSQVTGTCIIFSIQMLDYTTFVCFRELLEGIATYEQQVLSENTSSFTKTQLQPLNFGGDNLLKKVPFSRGMF